MKNKMHRRKGVKPWLNRFGQPRNSGTGKGAAIAARLAQTKHEADAKRLAMVPIGMQLISNRQYQPKFASRGLVERFVGRVR